MRSKNWWIVKLSQMVRGAAALVAGVGLMASAASQSSAQEVGPLGSLEIVDSADQGGGSVLGRLLKGEPNDPRIWASADYLLWFTQSTPIPPMLTTGPMNVVGPSGYPGVLGKPGTQVLIGDTIGFSPASGVRLTAGMWLDPERQFGVEGSYIGLPNRTNTHTWSSTGLPGSMPLSVPFNNAQVPAPDSSAFALPGSYGGTATLTAQSQFQTAEVNILHRLGEYNDCKIEGMLGYRWGQLDEVLQYQVPTSLSAFGNNQDFFSPTDRFHSKSNFNAAQLGLRGHKEWGRLGLTAWSKFAMGGMYQVTKINGALYTNNYTNYQAVQAFPGGIYAQQTNSGFHSGTGFAVMPELGLNGSIKLLECLKLNVGYSFLYLSNVVRPGDQINTTINPSQSTTFTENPNSKLVGVPAPAFSSKSSDWWAHGMNFGLEFLW